MVVFDSLYYSIVRVSDGKELRRVEMPKGSGIGAERVAMSVDEQYIYFYSRGSSQIHSLSSPGERYSLKRVHPFFIGPYGDLMPYSLQSAINFKTGELVRKPEHPLPMEGGNPGKMTLFNTRSVQGGEEG